MFPRRHVVRRGNDERALEPRLMAVLVRLASTPGEVVTRSELLDAVWGGTVVQEEALTQAVSQLRRLLDDDPRAPSVIETIPKQGYRLIATVTTDETAPSPLAGEPAPRPAGAPMAGPVTPPGGRRPRWFAAAAAGAAVVIVAGALAIVRQAWNLGGGDVPGSVTWLERPLTAIPGEEGWPALSPDGTLVAFAHREEGAGAFHLQLLRIATGETFPVTSGPADETAPAWSPDGERLAFARLTDEGQRLCVVAAMGGAVQELGPVHWALGGHDWSPDGTSIIYSAKDRQEEPMRLRRLRVADGSAALLTAPEPLSRGDTWPRFSPDGRRLAFVRSDRGSSREVVVMDERGGEPQRVAGGFSTTGGLDWAGDGSSLVVSATWRGPYELWRLPLAGGAPQLLPAKGHRVLHPDCGTGAGPLVFVDSVMDTELELRRVDAPGQATPLSPSTRLDMGGRFSPDGRSVLFVSERGGPRELWLLDRGTGAVRALAGIAGDALQKPRWSPDGLRVAVNVTRDGWLQVVVVDLATGLQRQATPAGAHHRLGHWSADGRSLFVSRERGAEWQIARVEPDGAASPVDVACPGCLTLHEADDGTLTYFKETAPGLYRARPGGHEDRLAVPEDDGAFTGNVEVTAAGAWYTRTAGGASFLSFRDFTTGERRDLVPLPAGATGEFDVAANGREVLIVTMARSTSDLVLVAAPAGSAHE